MKAPPVPGSSTAAKTGGESIPGMAHQSMALSVATSAPDRPSPITPYAPMGAKPSRRNAAVSFVSPVISLR